ncbi:MAG TPA: hypothetical protein PLF13_04060 [candidate division Zixibacteria bacterium]|nr:hypothetical protein [candidate division Zixibacteria bacterium]
MKVLTVVLTITFLAVAVVAMPPSANDDRSGDMGSPSPTITDNSCYITTDNILMFVTNHGNFGRDVSGTFGYDAGTFYPFRTVEDITGGLLTTYVLYAAGPWLGGLVDGQLRIAIAEYDDEYVPGPMNVQTGSVGGIPVYTFDPDCWWMTDYRVYHLYSDSLAENPNQDYNEWPVSQGAPVTASGAPAFRGDEMLWTVFNDANPDQHQNNAGETDPLGIEIRMTAWAEAGSGDDLAVIGGVAEAVNSNPAGLGEVNVAVVDPSAVTGHDYIVVFEPDPIVDVVWHVIDVTSGVAVVSNQTNQSGQGDYPTFDGLTIQVIGPKPGVIAIDEIANADGPLEPPDNVMYSSNSTRDWYITSDERADFSRMNWRGLMTDEDYELRFTAAGSQYYDWDTDELMLGRAPFEAWNIGTDTPNDPSDDIRLNFFIIDDDWSGDWSYGDRLYLCEHPYEEPAPNPADYVWPDDFKIGRIVFNDNSGMTDHPDEGTIVRFECKIDSLNRPVDTFSFSVPEPQTYETGGHGNIIHIAYKLYNKGGNDIQNCYFSLWTDPDVGDYTEDLVGCDSTRNIGYCYNGTDFDNKFGHFGPAIGFEIIHGPLVPSPSDTAVFDGAKVPDYRNLGMTAFTKYINGTDPNSAIESYNYMRGLTADGNPYSYGGNVTTYMISGDPTTGTGDLDSDPADRRMMLSCGPFDFAPGDSQYVEVKMVVGQGEDRLSSITRMKEMLDYCCLLRGDFTHDAIPSLDISDLVRLVDYIFRGGTAAECAEEADVNADGGEAPDISDIVYFVHYIFLGGPAPVECP